MQHYRACMTPEQFIEKWRNSELTERAGSQQHFLDLCLLLDEPNPSDTDQKGDLYCFERGALKSNGGKGWADVWKKGHFGWEYKGKHKNLDAAFQQLQQYAIALENPPLLVVCDMLTIIIYTNFTNTVQEKHVIELDDLRDANKREMLRNVFSNPKQLKPSKTRDALTKDVAQDFCTLAQQLRDKGCEPERVAHFINRLVFCMFAEDVQLLPNHMFTKMLQASIYKPADFQAFAEQLFAAMQKGGLVGFERVEWFNGGLFNDSEALPLTTEQIKLVLHAALKDWSAIDPSIFGTLFERGLDPDKRSQLGAHYTDHEKIMMIIRPTVLEPLEREWTEKKAAIVAALDKAAQATTPAAKTKHVKQAEKLKREFIERISKIRVLDPACGSGNFLYLALLTLKDFEYRVQLICETLGLQRDFSLIGPEVLRGIELNPYAAELARVSIWIGDIQWHKSKGLDISKSPILKPLEVIECRDAVLNADGSEAAWPDAEFIIGNPPFLGSQRIIGSLGDAYASALRTAYEGRVSGGADLVTYWFAKATDLIAQKKTKFAGLVSTNSIRGGANRKVLDRLLDHATIINAWSDEPWVVDGAAVRVSLICFASECSTQVRLNGQVANAIHSDLTSASENGGLDLTKAKKLIENRNSAFQGPVKVGKFEVAGSLAREWIGAPINPNGKSNSDVLRPWVNGMDITRRPSDSWIIDYGVNTPTTDAALYEFPFQYLIKNVKPARDRNRDVNRRNKWHLLGRTGADMRSALLPFSRYIITPRVSKFRLFVYMDKSVLPDSATVAIARDDNTTFGILHSRYHEMWALRLGTALEDRPRYTPSTTFETFPFPDGLTPNIPAADYAADPRAVAIAAAAKRLNELRENWLNPPDLVVRVPEVVAGYPDRILPKDAAAAATLRNRTLTKLYNTRPAWLDHAHRDLDAAVAAAYGWPAEISDDAALAKLLELNLHRAT